MTNFMHMLLAAFLALVMVRAGSAGERAIVHPFEIEGARIEATEIDRLLLADLSRRGIEPAATCSDEVFLRRVYLDVIGTLPGPAAVELFVRDPRPDKRAAVIDTLLERDEFATYWAMKWCDLLRVKAEFPINLWPNAVQAYHRWVHDALRANKPYDDFVREMLTSSGSNFRVPPVNFYRAIQGREPAAIADAVALTFMGTRLPQWSPERREQMAAFFSRVAYKQTAEWKEEIVMLDPAPAEPLETVLPDGTRVWIRAEQDPRAVFADWLLAPKNEWLARNIVNRVWAWLLGHGIIHEPDDIRPDNPPAHPKLLALLESELVKSDYDLKHVYRLILNSRTYQQSSIPHSAANGAAGSLFASYPVRRLDAEVLVDAFCQLFGAEESYTSPIPEPFSFIPGYNRTIALADGSISSPFLEMFGRPARDTGFESERLNQPTDAQRLHLLNSTHVQGMIERSPNLRRLFAANRQNRPALVRTLYLNILSRYPTSEEIAAVEAYAGTGRTGADQAMRDLVWAMVNSKEFLYRH